MRRNKKSPPQPNLAIIEFFGQITDPRRDHRKLHSLENILVIALVATVCGADDIASIELFGNERIDWFAKFLDVSNGIPSHDTFSRVLGLIDGDEFEQCFVDWATTLITYFGPEVIAIDGKAVRRSHDRKKGKSPIHIVGAWAAVNGLSLGQVKTDAKSNEITAIPGLLGALSLEGKIVTIDAMGTQKNIAEQIVDADGDYILALKGNHSILHTAVEEFFETADANGFENINVDYYQTQDNDHGRKEVRSIWVSDSIEEIPGAGEWKKLTSIIMIESERTVGSKTSLEHRYYITSLAPDAEPNLAAIRSHWGIENSLHWVLDVVFGEDGSRARIDNLPENLSTLRRMALNLLRREKSAKVGLKIRRLKCGLSTDYLERVLSGQPE